MTRIHNCGTQRTTPRIIPTTCLSDHSRDQSSSPLRTPHSSRRIRRYPGHTPRFVQIALTTRKLTPIRENRFGRMTTPAPQLPLLTQRAPCSALRKHPFRSWKSSRTSEAGLSRIYGLKKCSSRVVYLHRRRTCRRPETSPLNSNNSLTERVSPGDGGTAAGRVSSRRINTTTLYIAFREEAETEAAAFEK